MEGIWNSWFPNRYVERIADKRKTICESNVCGYYDPKGENEKCYVPGKPCCSGCGCNANWKQHSLSSYCYLQDIGKLSLWDTEMTEEEENKFRTKTGITNE